MNKTIQTPFGEATFRYWTDSIGQVMVSIRYEEIVISRVNYMIDVTFKFDVNTKVFTEDHQYSWRRDNYKDATWEQKQRIFGFAKGALVCYISAYPEILEEARVADIRERFDRIKSEISTSKKELETMQDKHRDLLIKAGDFCKEHITDLEKTKVL